MTKTSASNMELWNAVCETPPSITKHVNQRGGFTAICAQSQLKRATELWGAYGSSWGVKGCEYRQVGPAELPIEITLDAVFFYPDGKFELSADIKYRPGDDCRKKLLTDLTTKALSKLGFNSDIFEGKFDDNKYLAQAKAKESAAPPPDPNNPNRKPSDAERKELLAFIGLRRKSKGFTSGTDLGVLQSIARHVIGKACETITELKQIRTAIEEGLYDLDSGDPLELPEDQCPVTTE